LLRDGDRGGQGTSKVKPGHPGFAPGRRRRPGLPGRADPDEIAV